MLGRSEVVESTKSTHMARNSDKGIAGSEEQKRKRPTKSLCHHHKHHHHFFSSPNSMAVSSSLLPILLFITCFLVSGTSSFTTSLTTSGPPAANRGVKKAFLGIPVDFPRPPRQRSQAGLGGASSPLSAVTRSPHDGKAGGIKGFFNSERGADPERTGRAGSAMVLQEAFFSTWRRWSSAASLLGSPAHVARVSRGYFYCGMDACTCKCAAAVRYCWRLVSHDTIRVCTRTAVAQAVSSASNCSVNNGLVENHELSARRHETTDECNWRRIAIQQRRSRRYGFPASAAAFLCAALRLISSLDLLL